MLVFGDGLQMSPIETYERSVTSLGGNGERKVNETRTSGRRVQTVGEWTSTATIPVSGCSAGMCSTAYSPVESEAARLS